MGAAFATAAASYATASAAAATAGAAAGVATTKALSATAASMMVATMAGGVIMVGGKLEVTAQGIGCRGAKHAVNAVLDKNQTEEDFVASKNSGTEYDDVHIGQ